MIISMPEKEIFSRALENDKALPGPAFLIHGALRFNPYLVIDTFLFPNFSLLRAVYTFCLSL